jgi:hypothetical protein
MRHVIDLMLLVAFVVGPAVSGLASEVERADWVKTIESATVEYEYSGAAFAANTGEVWVVAASRPRDEFMGPHATTIWKVPLDGRPAKEVKIAGLLSPANFTTGDSKIRDLAMLSDGRMLLITESPTFELSIISIDRTAAKVLRVNGLGKLSTGTIIHKAVATKDAGALLIGNAKGSALIVKIRSTGEVVWERTLADAFTLLDGVENDDGSFAVAGNTSGADRKSSDIWAGQFTADGQMKQSVRFAGVYSSIARRKGGGYAIVFNTETPAGWDVWIRALGEDLSLVPEGKILSGIKALRPFRLAATRSGDFLVVGSRDWKLWIARVTPEGKVVWSTSYAQPNSVAENNWNFGVLAAGGTVLVPFTEVVAKGEPPRNRQVIHLLKIRAADL